MATSTKLKLVTREEYLEHQQPLWQVNKNGNACSQNHSLYDLIPFSNSTRPEVANYVINKYSKKGDLVLDPFCGSGNIPLTAAFLGRIPYCSDVDPFALSIASAKINAVDITAVTLLLQALNLKKPVTIDKSLNPLFEFYDIETLREILNLRKFVLNTSSLEARFLEVIALSILHGNNASYLSVYTNPEYSLSISEQKELNIRRRQSAEYRAVVPRLLKKTAQTTCDGLPLGLSEIAQQSVFKIASANNLSYLKTRQIDLICTTPPLPLEQNKQNSDLWLRHWFSDIQADEYANSFSYFDSIDQWLVFMNECLTEFARIVPQGKYVAFHLKDFMLNSYAENTAKILEDFTRNEMSYYWSPVELLSNDLPKNVIKPGALSSRSLCDRILVLRRN